MFLLGAHGSVLYIAFLFDCMCFISAISGYFVVDRDSTPGKLVFNRTVTLRDSYSKGGK